MIGPGSARAGSQTVPAARPRCPAHEGREVTDMSEIKEINTLGDI